MPVFRAAKTRMGMVPTVGAILDWDAARIRLLYLKLVSFVSGMGAWLGERIVQTKKNFELLLHSRLSRLHRFVRRIACISVTPFQYLRNPHIPGNFVAARQPTYSTCRSIVGHAEDCVWSNFWRNGAAHTSRRRVLSSSGESVFPTLP